MSDDATAHPVASQPVKALDPQTIDQLIANQTRELELRARELDIHQQQDRHNFEFARESLSAQVQDRQNTRAIQYRQRRGAYILAGFIAFMIVAAIIMAIWLGRDQVALEIVKSVVLLLGGGGAGYAIGRNRSQSTQSQTDSDADG